MSGQMNNMNYMQNKSEEINNMDLDALQKYSEEMAAEILSRLEDTVRQIHEYQNESVDIQKAWDIFGRTTDNLEKCNNLLKESVEKTRLNSGNAMLSMIELIKDSVLLNCTSIRLAQLKKKNEEYD